MKLNNLTILFLNIVPEFHCCNQNSAAFPVLMVWSVCLPEHRHCHFPSYWSLFLPNQRTVSVPHSLSIYHMPNLSNRHQIFHLHRLVFLMSASEFLSRWRVNPHEHQQLKSQICFAFTIKKPYFVLLSVFKAVKKFTLCGIFCNEQVQLTIVFMYIY